MDGQVVASSKYGVQVLVHNKRPKKSDTLSNIFLWRKPVTVEKTKIFCEIWRTSGDELDYCLLGAGTSWPRLQSTLPAAFKETFIALWIGVFKKKKSKNCFSSLRLNSTGLDFCISFGSSTLDRNIFWNLYIELKTFESRWLIKQVGSRLTRVYK